MAAPLPTGTSYATSDDVAAAWRDLDAAEAATADYLVGFASALLRTKVPGLATALTSGALEIDAARYAIVTMVVRVLSNPDGLQSETTGPLTARWADAAAGLRVTEDIVDMVTPGGTATAARPTRRFGSLRIGHP